MFYYRTMYDGTMKRVDLGRIDFTSTDVTSHPIDERRFTFVDVTP
jgi:hypothetical protein